VLTVDGCLMEYNKSSSQFIIHIQEMKEESYGLHKMHDEGLSGWATLH